MADFPLIKERKKYLDKGQIQFQKPFQMRGSVSEHYISGYVYKRAYYVEKKINYY